MVTNSWTQQLAHFLHTL